MQESSVVSARDITVTVISLLWYYYRNEEEEKERARRVFSRFFDEP
jgi:hypothetical protein